MHVNDIHASRRMPRQFNAVDKVVAEIQTFSSLQVSGMPAAEPTTVASTSSASADLPNLNISNGTCYAGPNLPMDSRFIPCGNADAQVQTCCWQGDTCLADRACFGLHDGGFNTYLAGCTDAEWNATDPDVVKACPFKPEPYENEPWVGLAYCGSISKENKANMNDKNNKNKIDENNKKNENAWIACPQDNSPATMLSAGPCVCPTVTQQRIVAFTDGPTLSSYASLPTTMGGSISWISPFSPTYASTATAATPTITVPDNASSSLSLPASSLPPLPS